MAAIILTGVRLMNKNGDLCASNDMVYSTGWVEGEGIGDVELTFAGDAQLLYRVWLWSAVLHVPWGVCAALGGVASGIAFEKRNRNSEEFLWSDDD